MSSALLHGWAPVPHLGVVHIDGEDAASFIHNQLTQDFLLLGPNEARLAAWCSAKGRVVASFIGIKGRGGDVLLVCPLDILATVVRRLGMFVLRAKARVRDASAEWVLLGLLGDAVAAAGARGDTWARVDAGPASLVVLPPSDGTARALWIAPAGGPLPPGAELPVVAWEHAEVRSGVVLVGLAATDAYVPQMLNYESVGGINFKKGCYPGQEVVARSQFRGSLKRRARIVHADVPLHPGAELFAAADLEQPCATVVQGAPDPAGGWSAVVSGQIAAFEGGALRLGSADGAPVALLPLPYPLLADL